MKEAKAVERYMKLIPKTQLFRVLIILISLLAMSMTYDTVDDKDYRTAIAIAEKKFKGLKANRANYKLIAIENDMLKNGKSWKVTYLSTDCISKEGLRNCMGGEIFIIVNVQSKEATVLYGE